MIGMPPSSAAYRIPVHLQGRALALHYQQTSARQIYRTLYPREDAPVKLDAFTRALLELAKDTARQVREIADKAGAPTNEDIVEAEEDPERVAELALMPAVMETPLAQADDEALVDLDKVRAVLLIEIHKCMTEPLPPIEDVTDVGEGGAEATRPRFQGYADPRSVRSATIAQLAGAVATNVSIRLRATELRVKRTVTYHNLRLASKMEAELAEREQREGSGSIPGTIAPPPRRTFLLDMRNAGKSSDDLGAESGVKLGGESDGKSDSKSGGKDPAPAGDRADP